MADLFDGFDRVPLVGGVTPLQAAPRLSAELGAEVYLKRDDQSGLGLGGNKLRKLEFILGDAVASGCDTLVTFGAIQSNHARQSAAACARLGLDCHLVLTESVPRHDDLYNAGGNVLLDELFGATLWHAGSTEQGLQDAIGRLEQQLDRNGARARWTPAGGSEALGALGYVVSAHELSTQCEQLRIEPEAVFVASSTGGTQAGLICGSVPAPGAGAPGSGTRIEGMAVYQSVPATIDAVTRLRDEVGDLLGRDCSTMPSVLVDGSQFGEGYGIPTEASREAMSLFARTEGVVLDPVYTAKAAAGLIERCRSGEVGTRGPVVFVHTGGVPGLFAYGSDALPGERPGAPSPTAG